MNIPYSFYPGFVLRSPRCPLTTAITEAGIDSVLTDAAFLESIYLASPVLYNECVKYKNGHIKEAKDILKLKRSVTKYYLRSLTRCTPFGLFSGCSTGKWTDSGEKLTISSTVERHTRFDMHYLCSLSQYLAAQPGIKEHLRYYTNNSFYRIGDEIRYVEYKYVAGNRIHQISSVSSTDYLEQLLLAAGNGISIDELKKIFSGSGINDEDISFFIDELINAQLLVSELEPAITGDEFIHQVLSVLKRIYTSGSNEYVQQVIEILENANKKLQQIDAAAVNSADAYREIIQLVSGLGVEYDEGKLFQIDMVRKMLKGGLPSSIKGQLLEALAVLNKLGNYERKNPNLQSFIKRFYERYEEKEMPLLEVLDTETGIGYLEAGAAEHAPLVADIIITDLNRHTQNYQWGPVEQYLMRKVSESYHSGDSEIEIKDEDLGFLNNERYDDLPPSMHIMFRVVNAATNLLYIENCGGASAAAILGRFAHADSGIRSMIDEVVSMEELLNPDVTFAEIIHLPESRVGNVLLHPAFRKYEIPYLAKSSLDNDHQVLLQNLMVSVKRDTIFLRCKKTGRHIIPRLSNAHNYQYNALPVYQFLCDMQLQQQRGALGFNWGSITHIMKTLPRVKYKNTILSPATWRLSHMDFEHLLDVKGDARRYKLINEFITKWKLPEEIVLVDGDNELLINFENDVLVNLFLDAIKKKNSLEMREFFYPKGNAVTDEKARQYTNQVVAVLVKNEAAYRISELQKKKWEPGMTNNITATPEWLYYKIYCGVKSADKILTDAIKPVTDILSGQNLQAQFFFIRFSDPLFHIRFRVRLVPGASVDTAVKLINEYIQPFQSSGHVWKVQTDTYNREIERYGSTTMEHAESIFHHDSAAVLSMLCETWGDDREHIRWLWAMRAIDGLFEVFQIPVSDRMKICDAMRLSFASEFNADNFLREQINAKFRSNRSRIEHIMNKKNDNESSLQPLVAILNEKNSAMESIAMSLKEIIEKGQSEVPLFDLLGSYIHMLVNRVVASKARLHEMVLYDFLYRYYKGILAQDTALSANVLMQSYPGKS
jgi:lantibiotic biosynthesis protein